MSRCKGSLTSIAWGMATYLIPSHFRNELKESDSCSWRGDWTSANAQRHLTPALRLQLACNIQHNLLAAQKLNMQKQTKKGNPKLSSVITDRRQQASMQPEAAELWTLCDLFAWPDGEGNQILEVCHRLNQSKTVYKTSRLKLALNSQVPFSIQPPR